MKVEENAEWLLHMSVEVRYGGIRNGARFLILQKSEKPAHLSPASAPIRPSRPVAQAGIALFLVRNLAGSIPSQAIPFLQIIDRCKPIVPTVTLVAKDRRTYQMDALTETVDQKPDGYLIVFSYMLSCPNFGNPCKVRLSCEEIGEDNVTHVHKVRKMRQKLEERWFQMILVENQTNTHVFLKVDADLDEFETMELECQYPDVGSNDGG